ncbi:unknown [Neodiprion lecontei nucleopolyhedrovirus]|uniref:Uncharacterized protein n=1 Tax=Neodiprion lecontei nucleopolyhedrovirus (strain Canada) TaxID=654906 RepID=Q6JP88_NPVNC|nr:unknown [Neodiprion lecontei nucleopolyhedrovirus]AAQ99130.1 unknown [Neodiprion lecontei nucleopolyhedrovirus]
MLDHRRIGAAVISWSKTLSVPIDVYEEDDVLDEALHPYERFKTRNARSCYSYKVLTCLEFSRIF